MTRVCRGCGHEFVSIRGLQAHDCPETNPKGSLAWQFAGADRSLEDYRDVTEPQQCPHGHGDMVQPVNGDPLEPAEPYCDECGHISGRDCDDGCNYEAPTIIIDVDGVPYEVTPELRDEYVNAVVHLNRVENRIRNEGERYEDDGLV